MKDLSICSHFGEYNICFVSDGRQAIIEECNGRPAHLLIDKSVWDIHQSTFFSDTNSLSRKIIVSREKHKTLDTVTSYIKFLLSHKIKKNHCVIVIGGGFAQDIGSFTTHILLRGIKWIFFPTTLLSMADSCIGSKSGINVGRYKNQVGAFHPPGRIYIYTPFLSTLPKWTILDGNGEIIKHAIIKGGKAFEYLVKNLHRIQENDVIAQNVIRQSLIIKKEIVEEDEFEKARRKLLNYGHTFGHALEGYTNNKISHGISVTIGIDIANFISMKRGFLTKQEFDRISTLLHRNIPYAKLPVINMETYLDFISHDKKAIGDRVYALLCRGIGKIEIVPINLDKQLHDNLIEYIESYSKIRRRALSSTKLNS